MPKDENKNKPKSTKQSTNKTNEVIIKVLQDDIVEICVNNLKDLDKIMLRHNS